MDPDPNAVSSSAPDWPASTHAYAVLASSRVLQSPTQRPTGSLEEKLDDDDDDDSDDDDDDDDDDDNDDDDDDDEDDDDGAGGGDGDDDEALWHNF